MNIMHLLLTCFLLLCTWSAWGVRAQELPFGVVESACPCSTDGYSGEVNTRRPGCNRQRGIGAFCYVADPATCLTAARSRRYRGARYIRCTQCVCAEDGVSNKRRTGIRGCGLHSVSNTQPFCYVKDSSTCPRAERSPRFRGAYQMNCSYEEALFFAAKENDVDTSTTLRDLGVDLSVVLPVKVTEDGAQQQMTLAEYAAAHGSYAVVEDLLIEGDDFDCGKHGMPRSTLCLFSAADECNSESEERIAIERLLSLYDRACGPLTLPLVIGTPTPCRRYPYFVSLRWSYENNYKHYCGGVLIEKKFVLTAAHCVDPIYENPTKPILLIESDSSQPDASFCPTRTEFRKSKNVIIHDGWFRGPLARSLGNPDDIALIEMNWRSRKQPIEWEKEQKFTANDVMTGIGLGRSGQTTSFSPVLQQYQGNLRTTEICNLAYERIFQDGILCVGGSGPDFCAGDDGGPLVSAGDSPKDDQLVGLAHLKDGRIPCGTVGVPGLFLDLAYHHEWIQSKF